MTRRLRIHQIGGSESPRFCIPPSSLQFLYLLAAAFDCLIDYRIVLVAGIKLRNDLPRTGRHRLLEQLAASKQPLGLVRIPALEGMDWIVEQGNHAM